ncbi:hypothetical protein GLOIN_2v1521207, partial [Rhizophagus irregularis DAOM 181602=DAOM 197198]
EISDQFPIESISLVKSIIRRSDYMISIDLNQAFYHILLADSQQSYFTLRLPVKTVLLHMSTLRLDSQFNNCQ